MMFPAIGCQNVFPHEQRTSANEGEQSTGANGQGCCISAMLSATLIRHPVSTPMPTPTQAVGTVKMFGEEILKS